MDIMCITLDSDSKDDELKECIQKLLPVCMNKKQGFCFTLTGFDSDKRELWEIPEAINFMKKLCDIGFISLLEISTSSKHLIRESYNLDLLPGFGALEVWMCANKFLGTGHNAITENVFAKFQESLQAANKKAWQIVQEPIYKTGISKKISDSFNTIPDAPIRHGGVNRIKDFL